MELFWLNDAQWGVVAAHLPAKQTGPKRSDDRVVISGIVHVLCSGCAWRDCPPDYGPAMTVFNRYNRWRHRGVWQRILHSLTAGNHLPPLLMANGASLESAMAERSVRRGPLARSPPGRGDSINFTTRQAMSANAWNDAAAQLNLLAQANAGKPIAEWIGAVVEWHMDAAFRQEERAWIPGMAGTHDPLVEKAVERFNQHNFKSTVERLTADIAEIKMKLHAALASIVFYADNPAKNASNASAALKKLLQELTAADTPPAMPRTKAS